MPTFYYVTVNVRIAAWPGTKAVTHLVFLMQNPVKKMIWSNYSMYIYSFIATKVLFAANQLKDLGLGYIRLAN